MRVRQATLYSSTVALKRYSATGTWDPDTATYGSSTTTTVYTGPALVRAAGAAASEQLAQAGETTELITPYVVKLPYDTDVRVGDVVAVTASTHDAGLVGLSLRVASVLHDEWQIARVCLAVDEVNRPAT